MMNAASTSNPSFKVNVGEAYPYPSHAIAPNFVTMKLSGNGKGKVGDIDAWIASDSLVKGWILGSLSDGVAKKVVSHLKPKHKNTDLTAKDVWDEVRHIYGPSIRELAVAETKVMTRQAESVIDVISVPSEDAKSKDEPTEEMSRKVTLYKDIIEGYNNSVIEELKEYGLRPWDKLTNNGNTVLHVAVGSSTKNHELLQKLLEMTPAENTLLDLINSDGSSLLHVAAIGGNIEAVNMLVERNPELLLATDKEGHTPLALSISNMHTKTSHCLFEHMKVYRYLLEEKEKEYDALFTGKSGEDLVVLAISCQDFGLAKKIIDDYLDAIVDDSDAVLTALAQNFPRELNFWERGFKEEFGRIAAPYAHTYERLWKYADSSLVRQPLIIFPLFFVDTS